MTQKFKAIRFVASLMLALTTLTSCIFDDLSANCGTNYRMRYTIEQSQALDTEIATQLTSANEQVFGNKLKAVLSPVFTDKAQDLNLSFFDLQHQSQYNTTMQMQAHTATYDIYLQPQDYHHIALANLSIEPLVKVSNLDNDAQLTLCIDPTISDTIASQSVGIFTAQADISSASSQQDHSVTLYMKNCATALVLDRNGQTPSSVTAYVKNTASSFCLTDSTYHFTAPRTVKMTPLTDDNFYGFHATTFPSLSERDNVTLPAENGYWEIHIIVLQNGKYTKNVLKVSTPLRAGDCKIIKAKLTNNGGVVTNTQHVGVSVELDWKPGGNHEVDM